MTEKRRWWVGLHRTLLQTAEVTVEADTKEEAEKLALQQAASGISATEWMEPRVKETTVNYAEEATD